MGRLATVNAPFSGVTLPSTTGVWQSLAAGQTVVLTEAEAVLTQVASLVTLGAVTLAAANSSPEPLRPNSDKLAYPNVVESQFTTAAGGTIFVGSNVVTGPAAGVTYTPGFLVPAANNGAYGTATGTQVITLPANPGIGLFAPKNFSDPSISNTPPQVGAVSGGLSELNVFHVQGAVVSVAPLAKNWIGDGFSRADSAGTTNASPTVTDTSILATDTGRLVTGTGIPVNTYVGTVTVGTSFLLSSSPTSQANVNATATGSPTITLGAKTVTQWAAGTVPTFTASVGAIDYFQFVSYDGGRTWINALTIKGLA